MDADVAKRFEALEAMYEENERLIRLILSRLDLGDGGSSSASSAAL